MPGSLFTRDYLAHGVRATAEWRDAQGRLPEFRAALSAVFAALPHPEREVEAQIEASIVQPVLDALGWSGLYAVQAKMEKKGRRNVPDYLFFAGPEDHARALAVDAAERYRHAIALGDAKAWSISLDKRGGGAGEGEAPTGQLLRYMDAASAASDRRVLWGLLTNGRVWRLYYQDARSRLDDYFEIDLAWALEQPGAQGALDLHQTRPDDLTPADALTLFLLFFARDAFLPGVGGRTRHQAALEEGRRWEARIRDDLSEVVFEKVFPGLIRAVVAADRQARLEDPAYLVEVREAALTALYRLLFALYAEDRDLLPTRTKRFDDYSLSGLRDQVATRLADDDEFSARVGPVWAQARNLFRLIDEGDDGLGVPPYNGGLFSQARSPLLERIELPDAAFAPLLNWLSHVDGKRINYRDLSVRELGSIYERLLEHEPVADPAAPGGVDVRLSVFARKGSGSYYTPDVLVKLIIQRTLTPLAEEAEAGFKAALDALPPRASPETVQAELDAHDPAARILRFKVVDPAMGSGHFLVSLVDWLAERALLADEEATGLAREAGITWSSPATREIVALRQAVRAEAVANGWIVSEDQLSDANLIKRAVLKRCVFGVDKNPMAVELAKVALWLHTFTAGAPLSFLDHHLRCGDSLFGERVADVLSALHKRGSLLIAGAVTAAEAQVKAMEHIEGLADARLVDVKDSERTFADLVEQTAPLTGFLDLWHAVRWLRPAGDDLKAWHGFLDSQFGDPLAIAAGSAQPNRPRDLPADATVDWLDRTEAEDQPSLLGPGASTLDYLRLVRLLNRARALVAEQRFLHWQVAFPGVWRNWTSTEPQGGFDAVIGNPPYLRQEAFVSAKPILAQQYEVYAGTADLSVYFFEQAVSLAKRGGSYGSVTTNKWLKAGYARRLRAYLTASPSASVNFVVDFGHAKHLFPDADVSPVVTVVGNEASDASGLVEVSSIPRDAVPRDELETAVSQHAWWRQRSTLGEEAWTLERATSLALMRRMTEAGTPLKDFVAEGPLYGVKTGDNDVFLISGEERAKLIGGPSGHPSAAEIIKPYLRGQDIRRWTPEPADLWMLATRQGIEISRYPSVQAYLEKHRTALTPKPAGWTPASKDDKWPGRKGGTYQWYELQDPVAYWDKFSGPKLVVKRIAFYAEVAIDYDGRMVNDSAVIIPGDDAWVAACLNSRAGWFLQFKRFPHKKDEALAMDIPFLDAFPIAPDGSQADLLRETFPSFQRLVQAVRSADRQILDWLRSELGLASVPRRLAQPHKLSSDQFVEEVRRAAPRALTSNALAAVRGEYSATLDPAKIAAAQVSATEREFDSLINAAYGLDAEQLQTLASEAPPRSPNF